MKIQNQKSGGGGATRIDHTEQALESVHQINAKNVEFSYNDNEGLLERDVFKAKQLPRIKTGYNNFCIKSHISSDSFSEQEDNNMGYSEIITPMLPPGRQDSHQTKQNDSDRPKTLTMMMKNSLSDMNLEQNMDYQNIILK